MAQGNLGHIIEAYNKEEWMVDATAKRKHMGVDGTERTLVDTARLAKLAAPHLAINSGLGRVVVALIAPKCL